MPRTAKSILRSVGHRFGYDIVSLQSGFPAYQSRLIDSLRPDLMLDVGANEGQYAQRMRGLGHRGPIVSFEPGREAFSRLEGNARHDPAWEPVRSAVGATEGTITLHVSANSVSSSTLPMAAAHEAADPRSRYASSEDVPMTTLDGAVGDRGERIWLKIDVQGAEDAVLAGAGSVLARCVVVQVELSLVPLYAGQADARALVDALGAHGLALSWIEPGFADPATGDLLQCDGIFRRRPAQHGQSTAVR